MQWRIFCSILNSANFLSCCLFSLFVAFSTTAIAEGGYYQYPSQSSAQDMAAQRVPDQYRETRPAVSSRNPWALPAIPLSRQAVPSAELQAPELSCGRPDVATSPSESAQRDYGQIRPERFVTPQILESLKQQQTLNQMMPENRYYSPYDSYRRGGVQRSMGSFSQGGGSQSGYYQNNITGPAYGAGAVNPLYEAPAVSPWGMGVDVLNQGGSFPMVPSEAIGGISPMYVPSYGMDNYNENGSYKHLESNDAQVFNPFTFLPNSGIPKR